MSGLILPPKPRLLTPADTAEQPPERRQTHLPPQDTWLRCRSCGTVQATRERQPWHPEALAGVRCPVCRGRGAELATPPGR